MPVVLSLPNHLGASNLAATLGRVDESPQHAKSLEVAKWECQGEGVSMNKSPVDGGSDAIVLQSGDRSTRSLMEEQALHFVVDWAAGFSEIS